jgi:hypothetical protein
LGRRGEPGWRGEWYGSVGQATSCLILSAGTHGGHDGGRLTLENVETNATQSVDVGVVDLGEEADLGRGHGVVVWEEELELKHAA